MDLIGIHHVTALTADLEKNYHFYTDVLGMRLVKKTVNHDEPSSRHFFYADGTGQPGTELTFFESEHAKSTSKETGSISNVSLRVPNDEALHYWKDRFNEYDVDYDDIIEQANRKTLHFRDPEGTPLTLVSDEVNPSSFYGQPWDKSTVPTDKGIIGLGPVKMTVENPTSTLTVLTRLLTFKEVARYPSQVDGQPDVIVLATGEGGTGAEIHIETRHDLLPEEPGSGSVDHIALRVKDDEELRKWKDYLDEAQMPNSGLVDRFYFRSVYFREPNGILFELATDEPGFTVDEDIKHLGESLSLPPALEKRRKTIEADLTPFSTVKK